MSKNNLITALVCLMALVSGSYFYASLQQQKLQLVSGEKITLADYRGQWIVINFFAEWCRPCLKEVPELNRFNQYAKENNVKLLAVSFDPLSQSKLTDIVAQYQMEFDVVLTSERPVLPVSWPAQLPTTYIISPAGEISKTLLGEVTSEKLQQYIVD